MIERYQLPGSLCISLNRRGDKLKVLYFHGQGLCLWYERLESGRFKLPSFESLSLALTVNELALLLNGLEIELAERMPSRAMEAVA